MCAVTFTRDIHNTDCIPHLMIDWGLMTLLEVYLLQLLVHFTLFKVDFGISTNCYSNMVSFRPMT